MSSGKHVLFLSGVHGVGKSTMSKILNEKLGIPFYSASELIKKKNNISYESKKITKNILDNQDVLLGAINEYVFENKIILDGHFTLINKNGCIEDIPLSTFKGISIKKIVVLFDDVLSLKDKLDKRDGENYSYEFLENFQNREISHASFVAEKIGVPLLIHHVGGDIQKVIGFI